MMSSKHDRDQALLDKMMHAHRVISGTNDGAPSADAAAPQPHRFSVSVQLVSGDVLTFDDIAATDAVFSLKRKLVERDASLGSAFRHTLVLDTVAPVTLTDVADAAVGDADNCTPDSDTDDSADEEFAQWEKAYSSMQAKAFACDAAILSGASAAVALAVASDLSSDSTALLSATDTEVISASVQPTATCVTASPAPPPQSAATTGASQPNKAIHRLGDLESFSDALAASVGIDAATLTRVTAVHLHLIVNPIDVQSLWDDFYRWCFMHSWYKHIQLPGDKVYAFQQRGEQIRHQICPEVSDADGAHFHFSRNREPRAEHACGPVFVFCATPFIGRSNPDIVVKHHGSEFVRAWLHRDWPGDEWSALQCLANKADVGIDRIDWSVANALCELERARAWRELCTSIGLVHDEFDAFTLESRTKALRCIGQRRADGQAYDEASMEAAFAALPARVEVASIAE